MISVSIGEAVALRGERSVHFWEGWQLSSWPSNPSGTQAKVHFFGAAGTMPRFRTPEPLPGGASCESRKNTSKPIAFEISSKRRKGFPSETHVKRGNRVVGGTKELLEKLGRNDPCPCGSGRRF